jgi:hypothetical protein
LFEKGNRIGVLISPGYGAGWKTWASDNFPINVALDKRVIEKWLELKNDPDGREKFEEWILGITGADYFYTGGWENLKLVFVPKGSTFKINEYDGFESISLITDPEYMTV